MPSHKSTPDSVLNAPLRKVEIADPPEGFSGMNRRERRWYGYGVRQVRRLKPAKHWLRVLTEEREAARIAETLKDKE